MKKPRLIVTAILFCCSNLIAQIAPSAPAPTAAPPSQPAVPPPTAPSPNRSAIAADAAAAPPIVVSPQNPGSVQDPTSSPIPKPDEVSPVPNRTVPSPNPPTVEAPPTVANPGINVPTTPSAGAVAQPNLLQRRVFMQDLPVSVRESITAQAGPAPVQIQQTSPAGSPVYEVTFQKSGQPVTFQVNADGTMATQARTVIQSSLPPSIVRSLGVEVRSSEILGVEKEIMQFFSARFQKDGKETELKVLEDGTPLTGKTSEDSEVSFSEPLTKEKRLSFDETPLPVQKALQDRAGLALIENIRQGEAFNKQVYQAAFKKDGKHTEIRMGPDGTLVGMREKPAVSAKAGPPPTLIRFLDAPEKVRATFQAQAAAAGIESLERQSIEVYRIRLDRAGTPREMRVVSDGTILRGGTSGGVAASQVKDSRLVWVSDNGTILNEGTGVTLESRTGKITDEKMTFAQLPSPVQTTLNAEGGAKAVSEVRKGTREGRIIYHVTLMRDGTASKLQIAEDGALIVSGAGAEK